MDGFEGSDGLGRALQFVQTSAAVETGPGLVELGELEFDLVDFACFHVKFQSILFLLPRVFRDGKLVS